MLGLSWVCRAVLNLTSLILQEILTFADVGVSAAVCGQYKAGTVQLYPGVSPSAHRTRAGARLDCGSPGGAEVGRAGAVGGLRGNANAHLEMCPLEEKRSA